MPKPEKTEHRVLVGLNYPPNKRAEVGDIVADIPDFAVESLESMGAIERVEQVRK